MRFLSSRPPDEGSRLTPAPSLGEDPITAIVDRHHYAWQRIEGTGSYRVMGRRLMVEAPTYPRLGCIFIDATDNAWLPVQMAQLTRVRSLPS